MKVVLFCGGQGMRIREVTDRVPKPMVRIGDRPILLHVMKYYAHFGHTEFILCLGYQGHVIKEYFLNYREALLNDFVLSNGGKTIDLLGSDIQDWRITFVDTGLHSNVGQRLRAVREQIGTDEMFLANYADGLTDLQVPDLVSNLTHSDKIGTFLCVRPSYSFHVVRLGEDDAVKDIEPLAESDIWINGGYFAFRREIFDYIGEGEELVEEPFRRLIGEGKLLAHRYEGFWTAMDTFKDLQRLEGLYESGSRPWALWQTPEAGGIVPGMLNFGLDTAGMLTLDLVGSVPGMLTLGLGGAGRAPARVLMLGAHADDIEIGCGGTVLRLMEQHPGLEWRWVVLSGAGERADEARASAASFLAGAEHQSVQVHQFRDGFFPYQGAEIKETFEQLKRDYQPDLIFTHYRQDLHQDHRLVSELTWNTFRDHLILEYEIPKYDGDLGVPGFFVHLDESALERKVETLLRCFPSQAGRHWFTRELFFALPRIRGMESNAPSGYAEAFYCRKAVL